MLLIVLALVSGLSFLYYGAGVIRQGAMRDEFERYGLQRNVRTLVGVLELLGGVGVLIGLVYGPLGAVAAAGLCALMVLGLLVRSRLRDPPRQMAPAAALATVNGVLIVLFATR
jgi:uncharacterized membrane protein YphA (DoxX/SURF4 family)